MIRRAAVAFLVALVAAASATKATEPPAASAAETCWRARALGFESSGRVDPGPARCAADGFAALAEAAPDELELAFRAVEALWFAAHFTDSPRAARADLERAVRIADAAAAEIDRRAGIAGGLATAARAEALAEVPGAGEAHFWRVVAWGEWSLVRGSLAAAAAGAVGRLHESAELAARLAPDLRDGGGLRLLGRLHATAPRLPWITGWVDRARGGELLRAALARSRRDPRNQLFLAEALLDADAGSAEAAALLRELAVRRPDPAFLVEQSETIAAGRRRLAEVERDR